MAEPSTYGIKCRYFFQKFTLLIDNKSSSRHIIFHFHFLDFSSILYSKGNLLRFQITIRSHFFTKSICFTHSQPLNQMFLTLYRFPCIYYIFILIENCQCCSGKFNSCCNVRFFHCDFGRLIFKFRCKFYYFHILSLISCSDIQCFIRRYITCRCCKFSDIIFAKWQVKVKDCIAIFIGYCFSKKCICFHNHIFMCQNILFRIQIKLCTSNNRIRFCIFFHNRYFHLLTVIVKGCCLLDHCCILIFIRESNCLCFLI